MPYSKPPKKTPIVAIIFASILIAAVLTYFLTRPKVTSAQWYNDSWNYRNKVPVTNNTTVQTNVYVNMTIDTSNTSNFQSDCGDLRFTNFGGNILQYFISSGCTTSNTVIHVQVQTFPAGLQDLYYYYGNPSASNGFVSTDFPTVATNYSVGTVGSQEIGEGPLLYWKLDEGTGTTAYDSSGHGRNGTLTNTPTWQTEDLCITGKCLYFLSSSSEYIDYATSIPDIKSVSFWVKPVSFSNYLLVLNGAAGNANLTTNATGIISAGAGFTSPTIYVNGVVSSQLNNNTWQYVTVTTATAITASNVMLGRVNTGYLAGFMDDFKLYPTALTAAAVKANYASRGAAKGTSAQFGQASTAALNQGLVGYWKMDENTGTSTTVDSSGNSLTGTLNNIVSGDWTSGKFGSTLNFSSTNKYVSRADNDLLDPTGDMTVSAWFNSSETNNNGPLVGKTNSTETPAWRSYSLFLNWNQTCYFFWTNSSGTSYTANCPTTYQTNTWTHFVGVKSGNKITAYLNGIATAPTTVSGTGFNTDYHFRIDDPSSHINSLIDDVRIYSRALSPAEVAQLYNFAPGPVGYWNFDENTGNTVSDISGNNNTGSWGGTLSSQWVAGKYGSAGNFNDANSNLITSGTAASLQVQAQTMSAWIYLSSGVSSVTPIIFSRSDTITSGGYEWAIRTATSTPHLGFAYYDGAVRGWYLDTVTLTRDAWHHVAGVWNQTAGTVTFYIDGVKGATVSTTTGTITHISGDTARIGFQPDNNYWDGKIDDLKIYNYVRTTKQVVEDMNAGHPAGGSPVGSQVGYWKFDEGYGDTAHNSGFGGSTLNGDLASSSNTCPGNAACPTWSNSGKINKALSFDGGDYTDVPDSDSLRPGNGSWSSSFWANPPNSDQLGVFMFKMDLAAPNPGYVIGLTGDSDFTTAGKKLLFIYREDITNTRRVLFTTNDVADGNWHHYAAIADKDADTVKLYRDGILIPYTTYNVGSWPNITNTDNLNIGGLGGIGYYLTTSMDEVKIYNYALTADEVKIDYNQGKAIVLGALSDTSQLTGGSTASNSASAAYCIPGDNTSCASPVGEWKMDENTGTSAYDTSGNGNTGTLTNSPSWTPGKIGAALNFNGSQYVNLVNGASIKGLAAYTASAWVKPSSLPGAGTVFAMYSEEVDNANNFWRFGFSLDNGAYTCTGNVFSFHFRVGDSGSTRYNVCGTTAITANNWYHVTAVFDSVSGIHKVYVNGILDGTLTQAIGAVSNLNPQVPPVIGEDTDPSNHSYFNGSIDDFKIYNYARTPTQIAWDYNRGGPIAWYKFDECSGSTAYDSGPKSDRSSSRFDGNISIGVNGTQNTTGTCTGNTTSAWKNGANGKYGSSLNFDGTDDYVNIPDNTTLHPGTGSWSFSLWANPPNSNQQAVLLAKSSTAAPYPGYSLELTGDPDFTTAGKKLLFIYREDVTNIRRVLFTNDDMVDGNWHHYVAVADQTADTVRLYRDGIQVSVTTYNVGSWPSLTNTDALNIGGYQGIGYSVNNQIDDVRIYNYALTQAQINMVYNQGSAVQFAPITGSP